MGGGCRAGQSVQGNGQAACVARVVSGEAPRLTGGALVNRARLSPRCNERIKALRASFAARQVPRPGGRQTQTFAAVDTQRIGFFGASQAGWIIPLAAELTRARPRFKVILSGPAVSTGAEQYYSDLTGDGARAPRVGDRAEVERLTRSFSGRPGFDPLPVLGANRVPTLWLLGGRDLSVPTFASARVLDSIRASGNDSHTVIVYAGADHGLRDAETGRPVPLFDDVMRWLGERGVLAGSR